MTMVAALLVLFSTCDVLSPGLGSKVDIARPDVSITSPTLNAYVQGDVTLTGSASDDMDLKAVTVTYQGRSGTVSRTADFDPDTRQWSLLVPVAPGAPGSIADGGKSFDIVASDNSGRTATVQHFLNIDNSPPTVLLNSPQNYGTVVSDYLDVEGKAYDRSPITEIRVDLLPDSANGDTPMVTKIASGDTSWSTRFVFGPGGDYPKTSLNETDNYSVVVTATDMAGNVSTYDYFAREIWDLLAPGDLFPTMNVIGTVDQSQTDVAPLTYAALFPLRVNTSGQIYVDFGYSADATKPVINYTNVNPAKAVMENVIGSQSPVSGFVRPGPAGNPVDGASIQARYRSYPGGSWVTVQNSEIESVNINGTYSFNIYLKNGGGSYLANGAWEIEVEAAAVSGSPTVATCAFYIDSNVPRIAEQTPSESYTPLVSDLGGTLGQGVQFDVQVLDDNDLTATPGSVLAARAATDAGFTTLTSPAPTVTYVNTVSGDPTKLLYNVKVPLSGSPTEVWIELTATDASGATSAPRIVHYRIDDQAPDPPVISQPTEASWIYGTAYMTTGTSAALDTSKVYLWFSAAADTPPADLTTWTVASGTTAWNSTISLASLTEGTYKITAAAADLAGNISAQSVRTFVIDQANPSLSGINISTGTQYRNAAFSLSGTATDTNQVADVTITERKDGGASAEIYNQAFSATNAPFSVPSLPAGGLVDGLYEYSITVTDAAGKTATATRSVMVDTTSPLLAITSPVVHERISTASHTVRGTVNDGAGKGVTALDWSLDGATWIAIPLSGTNWSNVIDVSGNGEGVQTLYIRAGDGLNPYATEQVDFSYDISAPAVTETAVNTSALVYASSDLTLSGTASDTNAVASVSVLASRDGGPAAEVHSQALAGTSAPWSYTKSVDTSGHGDDGSYAYTITATDAAGRTTSVSRLVTIDTTLPVVNVTVPSVDGWYLGNTLTASGTVTDANPVTLVEKAIDGGPYSAATSTNNWFTDIDLDTDGAGADTGLAEGSHILHVRATDAAGLQSVPVDMAFGVDQGAPVLSEGSVGGGTAERSALFALSGTAADTNEVASILVDQKKDAGSFVQVFSSSLAGSATPWSVTNLPRDPAAPGTPQLTDGDYEYRITLTDVAGRTASLSRHVRIDQTPPTVAISAPAAGSWLSGSAATASGTAADAVSGVGSVEWSTDGSNFAAASGTNGWNATLDLDTLGEGPQTLSVRATDAAGNASTVATRAFGIDQASPTLSAISIPTGTVYGNALFSLSATAADSNALANVTVTQSKDGATATTVFNQNYTGTSQTITVSSLPSGGLADGVYEYTITVTDAASKTGEATRTVQIDTTAPSVEFTSVSPITQGGQVNGIISVRGAVGDAVALTSVEYRVGDAGAFTSIASDIAASVTSNGSETSPLFTLDTTDTAYFPDETVTRLWIRATDRAGNVQSVALPLSVSQASDAPEISLTNMDTANNTPALAVNNLQENNAKVTGVITDDDNVDNTSVEISIDAAASWSPVLTQPAAPGKSVSFENLLSALSEDVHYFYLRASDNAADKAGAPAVTSVIGPVYFALDKAPPVLSITPGATYVNTPNLTLSGTVSDGSSTQSVTVSTDNGVTYSSAGVTFTAGAGSLPWNWTGSISSLPQGLINIKIKATDQFGKTTVSDYSAVKDTVAPVMSIDTPADGAEVNGSITLRGSGTETNNIVGVEFAVLPKGDTPTAGNFLAATGTFSWSAPLDTTALTDGTYTLHVRGTDIAGNVSAVATRDFVVNQSSDMPIISISTLLAGGTYTDNLLPGSLQISGTVSDDDAVENSSLEIQIDRNNDGDFADIGEGWVSINGRPAIDANVVTWSHTFKDATALSDGQYRFQLRAADINFGGNYVSEPFSWSSTGAVQFSVDTALPDGTVTAPVQGAFLRGTAGVVTINGTASDANGIKSVAIKVDGADPVPVTGTTSWSYDYSIASDKQVSYQIVITDNYDKIFTIDRYFTVDTTAPSVSFIQPIDASVVNGSMVIRGSSNDANQVNAVYLWMGPDGDTPPGDPANGDFTGWTPLVGTFSWQERVNTTTIAQDTYDIHVRATDNAGNISADSTVENVVVDQSTNLPVFSSVSLTAAPAINLMGTGATISGTITDDDAINAASIQVSFDDGSTWSNVSNKGSNGVTVNFSHNMAGVAESGSSYNVRLRASDVGDVANGVPVQTTTTAAYVVAVDRNSPTVAADSVNYLNRYDGTPIQITGGAMSGARVNNNLTVKTTASDASGIGGVTVSVNGGGYNAATYVAGTNTWDFPVGVDVAGHANDGTITLSIKATDVWGREGTSSLSLVIDTTEPSVSYLEPGAEANVNGTVTVRGTSFDGGALSSIAITGGDTDNVPMTNTGTIQSWTTTFDAYAYDEATYATDNGDGTWAFPLSVTVYDSAGNRTIATRSVNLDSNGDKPIIVDATLLPADGSSVAGAILLQSTVTDDDAPAYVRIYADLNDDGDYADSFAYDLSQPADGDTSDPFEQEGNFLQVPVVNGVWSTIVNNNNEFAKATMASRGVPSPSGFMRFHIIAYDTNATPVASTTAVRRVYVDATAPAISGLNYSSGALVNGNLTLSGIIEDDAAMTNNYMQISFDGGTTFQTLANLVDQGIVGGLHRYTFSQPVDTTTFFPDSSGIVYAVVKATDATFKQNQINVNFNVDNKLPSGIFDYNNSLPQVGPIYNFIGNASVPGSIYQVLGSAADSGLVSGIQDVLVYFVKGGNFYSPRNGAVLATAGYMQTVRRSDIDLNYDGDVLDAGESAGTAASIPVPPMTMDASFPLYYIQIDNRLELGQYDAVGGIGDGDGFEESLKAKSGFDEWYSFFDTTIFPDGPISVYYLVTDQAGNQVYGMAPAQIANNPPSIDSVEIDLSGTQYTGLFRRAGNVYLKVNASDVEGIDATSYKATITEAHIAPNGAETTTATPANGSVYDIADTTDGSAANDITIDLSSFDSGVQYTLTLEVHDSDGNVATLPIDLWVNNIDATVPRVSIDDFTQVNLSGFTGHIDEAGYSTNDAAGVSAPITSFAADRRSFIASSLIGNGSVQPGWTVLFGTGEWRTITGFDSGSGTVSWATPTSTAATGSAMLAPRDADISGTVTVTGTAWDDTGVTGVELSFDGGVTWTGAGVSFSQIGGDIISGFDYSFSYVLDTATLDWDSGAAGAQIAALDRPIMVRATDGTNTGTLNRAGADPTRIVDVVPYITRITRDSATLKLKTNRSRYGRYSVYQGETDVSVTGFNLNPTWARLYAAPTGGVAFDAATIVPGSIAPDYTSFRMNTGAASRAGYLRINVDGLDAVNNTNDNTRPYNHLYGTDGQSGDWSDDRHFIMWDTGDYFGTAGNPSSDPQHPAMTLLPSSSRLFGTWSSYATSDVFFAAVNTDALPFTSRIYHSYDTAEYLDIGLDAVTGTMSIAFLGNNSSDGNYADGHIVDFTYERTTNYIDGDVYPDGQANLSSNRVQWSRAGFDNWYYQGEGLSYDAMLYQFRNVRTARNGDIAHVAYYDIQSKTAKYAPFDVTLNQGWNPPEIQNWINLDGATGDTDGGENTREVTNGVARSSEAGEYLALVLDEQGLPVVIYYDITNATLRLARASTTNPATAADWTRQSVFQPGDPNRFNTGKHISAVVDDNGYLHIAFWSDDTGYLYYIKSSNDPDNGAAYTFDLAEVVDDTGTAGVWSDITLDRSGATDTPYISYLNSARLNTKDGLKMAYYDTAKGGWEYMVVATDTVVVQKRSNIEYKRGGAPAWNAALGYASTSRFELVYLMPQVP